MPAFHKADLSEVPILVTGGAGFVGSNIVKYLVEHGAKNVTVLDNLETGFIENIAPYVETGSIKFIEGSIRDLETCHRAVTGNKYILHQAALGSVPRSINNPVATHETNNTGFLNMLEAARQAEVEKFVFASSSSVYGNSTVLPKLEGEFGKPLSPYAVTKVANELNGQVFYDVYGLKTIGLRYFNIYGPHQRPFGPYAAAIPIFIDHLLRGEAPFINGDGSQTRDFTFVENAVQANIKALFCEDREAFGKTMNIAVGERISILDLYNDICAYMGIDLPAKFRDPRPGDVKDSLADISFAREHIGYDPQVKVDQGLGRTIDWLSAQVEQA